MKSGGITVNVNGSNIEVSSSAQYIYTPSLGGLAIITPEGMICRS
jgi:hypothetical protein